MDATEETVEKEQPRSGALRPLLQEIGLPAVVGLAGSLALLVVFGWLVEEIFRDQATQLDTRLALAVHGWANPTLDAVFGALSTVGGVFGVPLITLLAVALLVWRKHPRQAWRLVLAVAGGVLLSLALKFLFQRPRPILWPHAADAGYSFPSGHATAALCCFGMLAWIGLRLLRPRTAGRAWAVSMVALIVLIGLSRIYLGAHYPSDVLAGYLAGSFWLLMLLTGSDLLARVRGQRAGP